jgi:P27 family predicted phage terminase small subunit
MPGPVPKPAAKLRVYGSRKLENRPLATAIRAGAPPIPGWLPAEAKDIWRKTAAVLKAAGLLSPADAGVLTAYCLAGMEMQQCTATLAVAGLMVESHGQQFPHPLLKTRAAAAGRVKALAAELCLTPAARKRSHVDTGETAGPPDPMREFLRQGAG